MSISLSESSYDSSTCDAETTGPQLNVAFEAGLADEDWLYYSRDLSISTTTDVPGYCWFVTENAATKSYEAQCSFSAEAESYCATVTVTS
jgi:hypothetical protein